MYFKPPYKVSKLLGHYFILSVRLEDWQSPSFVSEFSVNRLWRDNGSDHQEAGSLHLNSKNVARELGDHTFHSKVTILGPYFPHFLMEAEQRRKGLFLTNLFGGLHEIRIIIQSCYISRQLKFMCNTLLLSSHLHTANNCVSFPHSVAQKMTSFSLFIYSFSRQVVIECAVC